jgi:mRNA interferase YafQ
VRIVEDNKFKKVVKRLNTNQKKDLDKAIMLIISEPNIGQEKRADLKTIRVHKFKMVNQLTLLAYHYNDECIVLTLISIGSHQNFYRDLK